MKYLLPYTYNQAHIKSIQPITIKVLLYKKKLWTHKCISIHRDILKPYIKIYLFPTTHKTSLTINKKNFKYNTNFINKKKARFPQTKINQGLSHTTDT